MRFVYEAGPCGYAVYRYLTGKGFHCTVCAPSLIARKPGDRVKTDQRDARKLVRALRMNDVSAVHVPDAADEAFRDLVRVWSAARQDLAKAKQRLKSFLLVHDVRYAGTANWGEAHRRWLAKFVFKETNSQLAFQEHLHAIDDRSLSASGSRACCANRRSTGASILPSALFSRCAACSSKSPSDSSLRSARSPALLQLRS